MEHWTRQAGRTVDIDRLDEVLQVMHEAVMLCTTKEEAADVFREAVFRAFELPLRTADFRAKYWKANTP